MKRTEKDSPARGTSGAGPEASETCKYKKGQNLHLGEKDVEALIKSLEARGAANRAPEATEPRPQVAAEPVALAKDSGASDTGERMSDEDLEDLALVMKMTRSATNARQCGLRLLEETRRAREAEARLMKEAVPATRTARRFPAA
jgi:hypothetical protein